MNNGHFFEHETSKKCQNDDFNFMWKGFTLHSWRLLSVKKSPCFEIGPI